MGQPTLKLDDSESWHLIKVLRARQGDPVALFDGCGNEWRCTLLSLDSTGAVLDVHKHFTVKRQGPWACSLAQALPKGKTMDQLVRRATEIGITRILPLETQRTEVHLTDKRGLNKVAKWRAAAIEACKQSGNSFVPKIDPVRRLEDWLKEPLDSTGDTLYLAACLEPPTVNLRSTLKHFVDQNRRLPRAVTWLIGPEGDFTSEEYQLIREREFAPISLAQHVLRVETAAIYALSILDYEAHHH